MAPLARSLVFIGFMGAGKSNAARAAAEALGAAAVDTDKLLQAELGGSIAEFFDAQGEAAFRAREEELVVGVLERAGGEPVALGGGSLGSGRVRAALERHTAVLLDVDAATAWERAGAGTRPLARDRAAFETLHAQRAALYEAAADAIVPASRAAVARALPALRALGEAPAGTRLVWATSASGDYPVHVGEGLLGSGFWPRAGRRFCVTDATVAELYGAAVEPLAGRIVLAPGEESKTIASAEAVWNSLAAQGMARGDDIVALGGGVVGDLAGFCAATYQRGMPVIHVPTTVVAQVDSAYGGKTGVDLPEAKNYVGAFHQPAAVLVDPAALATLPPAELAAGRAEVIKTALIAGGPLWERVRAGGGEGPPDAAVVLACARTKLAVVAEDERDDGRRQALNLGHTVGHAIEVAAGYGRLRHGEAVALGLLAALRLSGREDLRTEVRDLLQASSLPVTLAPGVGTDAVLAAVQRDKKRREGTVGFVLVDGPGEVRTGCPVPADDVRAAVEELRR